MEPVKITIKKGRYGNKEIAGEYTAVDPIKNGSKGWYVPIAAAEIVQHDIGRKSARVMLDESEAQELLAGPLGRSSMSPMELATIHEAEMIHTPETDAVSLSRMVEMFEILDEMGFNMAEGRIKGLIVFGPGGDGKSYGLLEALNQASLDRQLSDEPLRHTIHTGYLRTLHLYKALYEAREPGHITVFDDCDHVLRDPNSLNLLKAALDTTGERHLIYGAESKMLQNEEIPPRFKFDGSIVFVTNIDFANYRGQIHEHLQAMISRCHYLDLTIDTKRDQFLWMRYVTKSKSMLSQKGLTQEQAMEIIDFVEENINEMRELSLRLMLKLADLYLTQGKYDWRKIAAVTCMKRSGRSQLGMVLPDEK